MLLHLVPRHLASELSVLKPGKFVARRVESGTIVTIVLSIKILFSPGRFLPERFDSEHFVYLFLCGCLS
jgi:hypothetical protein